MTTNETAMHAMNEQRCATAAHRTVPQARAALQFVAALPTHQLTAYQTALQRNYIAVLDARVRHPHDSLAQLAARLGISRGTYGARLRSALRYGQVTENGNGAT